MSHTPGPWRHDGYRFYYGDSDESWGEFKHDDVFNIADADLIAAAPELLEALERLLGVVRFSPQTMEPLPFAAARAAIDKARGKQNAAQAESPGRSSEEG